MKNAKQPYVVCIGNAELLQDLRFEPDAKGVIQPSSEWRWKSFAGLLSCLLRILGCKTKLITKAYADITGQYLKQLLQWSDIDVRVVSTEPWRGIPEWRLPHGIDTRVIQKDAPPSSPVSRYASSPNLRFDEIPMEDLQGADLVVIASPLEAKAAACSDGSSAPTCDFSGHEWKKLNDTLSAASQISRQGIPVMCMVDRPFWGVKDETVSKRIEELLPHLQHIKFLWVGGLIVNREDAVLATLLQLKAELPHVLFPEFVADQSQPALPTAEEGASCCLRRSINRFMCCHTPVQESNVLLDSKLKPDEQDLLFIGGFIASHLKGSSVTDSMDEGARLAQDAKMLAALTSAS